MHKHSNISMVQQKRNGISRRTREILDVNTVYIKRELNLRKL